MPIYGPWAPGGRTLTLAEMELHDLLKLFCWNVVKSQIIYIQWILIVHFNVIFALSGLLFPVASPDNQDLIVSCHWILQALAFQLDLCLFLLL